MDTVLTHLQINSQYNLYDLLWGFMISQFATVTFFSIVLFVIVMTELTKFLATFVYPLNEKVYPFISLVLSFIAVLLLKDFQFTKEYFFNLFLTVAMADLIYTYFGKYLFDWIKSKFTFIKGAQNGI